MRLDTLLVDQPAEHLGRAVAGVGSKPLRLQSKAALSPFDHPLGGSDLGLANRCGRLDIDDDAVLEIDEVVGLVAELSRAAPLRGPADRRIHWRDRLGSNRRGTSERRIVEHFQILADGTAGGIRWKFWVAALAVGIGTDQTAINRETVTTDEAFLQAALDGSFEQAAQQVAVPKATVVVLREGQ
jgi:hypothetical protein